MLFRLCTVLKYPHPDYLAPLLSSKQISEWDAYFKIEPLEWRQDYRAGMICAILHNANYKSKRKPEDFFPELKAVIRRKQSVSEMKDLLMGMVEASKTWQQT